jgi:uncharacterized protein
MKGTIIFDRSSVRTRDENGYMHVAKTHISKAGVNPYYGREIPGWMELGLKADKIYQVYRPKEELEKGALTFNNVPLLYIHTPLSATDIEDDKEKVVGSTGTDAEMNGEYLDNSLVIWEQGYIDKVESGEQREISAAYRYDVVEEVGNYEGKPYTLKMTNIRGNHAALVEEGRAGSDVLVADSNTIKNPPMKKEAKKALAAILALAMDSKKPSVRQKAKSLLTMAHDSDETESKEDDLIKGLQDIQEEEAAGTPPDGGTPPMENPDDKPPVGTDGGDMQSLIADLKAVLDKYSAQPALDAEPNPDDEVLSKGKEAVIGQVPGKSVTGDAKIKSMIDAAVKGERQLLKERIDAARECEPIIGYVDGLAFDSAGDIYRYALEAHGEDLTGTEQAAYKGMVKLIVRQIEATENPVVQDSATTNKIGQVFPGLKNIRRK